jgi:hypothetical protein
MLAIWLGLKAAEPGHELFKACLFSRFKSAFEKN